MGAYAVFDYASIPLRLAVTMDTKEKNIGFWKIREFFLNLGRFVMLSISLIFFYYEAYLYAFIMYGLILIIYPFLIRQALSQHKL